MSKVEKVDVFKCRSTDRWDYANFVVVQRYDTEEREARGGYFMLAIESSYGNGYAFAWTHPGRCFYEFLAEQADEPYYVAKKMCQGDSLETDWSKTCEAVRRRICERRRCGECSADEARAAWPENDFECEYDFASWNNEQELLRDTHEDIASVPGRRAQEFIGLHKAFWADFARQLTETAARGAA